MMGDIDQLLSTILERLDEIKAMLEHNPKETFAHEVAQSNRKTYEAARTVLTPNDIVPKCKFCNGPMWDNSSPGAKRNPKAPDYKCKKKGSNANCNGAAWLRSGGGLSWRN